MGIVGLFFIFTIVKMKKPNKLLNYSLQLYYCLFNKFFRWETFFFFFFFSPSGIRSADLLSGKPERRPICYAAPLRWETLIRRSAQLTSPPNKLEFLKGFIFKKYSSYFKINKKLKFFLPFCNKTSLRSPDFFEYFLFVEFDHVGFQFSL